MPQGVCYARSSRSACPRCPRSESLLSYDYMQEFEEGYRALKAMMMMRTPEGEGTVGSTGVRVGIVSSACCLSSFPQATVDMTNGILCDDRVFHLDYAAAQKINAQCESVLLRIFVATNVQSAQVNTKMGQGGVGPIYETSRSSSKRRSGGWPLKDGMAFVLPLPRL
jgi:hypothetical protein